MMARARVGLGVQAVLLLITFSGVVWASAGTDARDEALVWAGQAHEWMAMEQWEQAVDLLYGALERFREIDDQSNEARALALLGRCYLGAEFPHRAFSFYNEALQLYTTLEFEGEGYAVSVWPVLCGIALSHEATGELATAAAYYREAITLIEAAQVNLDRDALSLICGERPQGVYELLADVLYRMGEETQVLAYAERARARAALDTLYQGGINPQQLLAPEPGNVSGVVDPQAIEQAVLQAPSYLEANEAVFSYFVTERGVYLWTIAWDEATDNHAIGEPVFIAYPREELLGDVVACRRELEPRVWDGRIGDPETLLGHFYERLIQPGLEALPESVDTLVFIPSGPLWYLPFAALAMTDHEPVQIGPVWAEQYRPRYLVEAYTLGYLHSLASLAVLLERTELGEGYIVLANPELTPEQREWLGIPDPYYEELRRMAEAFGEHYTDGVASVYVGPEATEWRAQQEVPGHRVVMFAAHAMLNPYVPLQSEIYLAPGEGPVVDGEQRIADGYYRAWEVLLTDHRGVELVILPACESTFSGLLDRPQQVVRALSDNPEEVVLAQGHLERLMPGQVGVFARSFLRSGAHSVLCTLWAGGAGPTEQLVVCVSKHHQDGLTWAEALRQAQVELIESDAFSDPFFWAPFQLIGRWR